MKKALQTDFIQIILRLFAIGILLSVIGLMLPACTDQCETRLTYTKYVPVVEDLSEIRASVASEASRDLQNPGKIYRIEPWLLILEPGEGIHLIDNRDKTQPVSKSFLNIPGCYDMAVLGNYLYADSYVDLLTFDISNLEAPKLLSRQENVFRNRGGHSYYFVNDQLVVGYEAKLEERINTTSCDDEYEYTGPIFYEGGPVLSDGGSVGDIASGQGGSMARFAIHTGHLYALEPGSLQVFSLLSPTEPDSIRKVSVGWDVETIFPYRDKLFLGSQSGMYIFDNSRPDSPNLLSIYEHMRACDPVVVEDTLAYVTLRDGTVCQNFSNQLEVISIKDARNPKLLASYPMQHPHGLGIDQKQLFVAEGEHGLKVFNAADAYSIGDNLLQHLEGMHAYDVIPYQDVLVLIGADGLYQYDYSDSANLSLLSVIPVTREES